MVTVVINRVTGERKVVDSYDDPADCSLEVIADCLAKMIIEHGLIEKLKTTAV